MSNKVTKKRTGLSPEQRARRMQQIFFVTLAVIVIVSMLLASLAR